MPLFFQLKPPTTAAYNHEAYPAAFEAAELQITNTYYALKSFSTEKAGPSDPDSARFQKANPEDSPIEYTFIRSISIHQLCTEGRN